jgi:hypothetical protein
MVASCKTNTDSTGTSGRCPVGHPCAHARRGSQRRRAATTRRGPTITIQAVALVAGAIVAVVAVADATTAIVVVGL